jgi:hypothetical protein
MDWCYSNSPRNLALKRAYVAPQLYYIKEGMIMLTDRTSVGFQEDMALQMLKNGIFGKGNDLELQGKVIVG